MEEIRNKKYTQINEAERELIERLLRNNTPKKQIERMLNRSITTIRKEIKRGSVEQRKEIKTTKKDANIPIYQTELVYFADVGHYRAKTRFAKFYNLPELMAMFKEVADIKTADMLDLPVPQAHYHNIAVKPSEMQKEMVASLAERAEKVRGGAVDSSVDNMLKITNDGRKLALDQRMLNDMLPDFEDSKINACVDNIYRIWAETADKKSAQLVFCDLSTPKNDGTFSV